MLIIQISDMHVKAPGELYKDKVDTYAFMERAIEHIQGFDPLPNVVLATGDLADLGGEREYIALRDLLAELTMPVYLIPGNHDARSRIVEVFGDDHAYLPSDGGLLKYAIENHPLRIVALDSLIEGEVCGVVDAEQRAWLDQTLAARPDAPTIVMLHHPPVHTGVPWLDHFGLREKEALGEVIGRHPQVLRVLSGHDHRPIQSLWHGTLAITAPSTAHQFLLTFDPESPGHWGMEPPGCLVHKWFGAENGGLITHTSYIGDYGPPYDF